MTNYAQVYIFLCSPNHQKKMNRTEKMWLKIFTCVSFLVISVICEIEDQAPAQSLHYEYGRHYGYGHHHVPVHEVHVPYGYAVGPHGLVHK